jgi:acyl-CoA oxidase
VLLDTQDHVVEVARAHVDQILIEALDRAVARCPDAGTQRVLDDLCSLHALTTIERERGWFQEHGRLSSTRSKLVIRAVNALCERLRPYAGELAEAFGVPETALGDAAQVAEG